MTPNELRLGNIIDIKFDDGKEGYWSWSYVKVNDLVSMEVFPDIYRPIPLTKEWIYKLNLSRIGFNDDGDIYCNNGNRDDIWIQEDNNKFFIQEYKDYKIEYVHQLQNLYFALTGIELCLSQKNH